MIEKVNHAFCFFIHASPHSLLELAENRMGELLSIIYNYQYPLKYVDKYSNSLKIHVGFSGILLEQLLNNEIIKACQKIIDIPKMIAEYGQSKVTELIGTGYSHPIFPLIPKMDWDLQIGKGKEIVMNIFGMEPKGFWPPEGKFCREMIPILKKYGYEFIIVNNLYENIKKNAPIAAPLSINHQGIDLSGIPYQIFFEAKKGTKLATEDVTDYSIFLPEDDKKNSLFLHWINIDQDIEKKENDGPEFWEQFFTFYLEKIFCQNKKIKSVFIKDFLRDCKIRKTINLQKNQLAKKNEPTDEEPCKERIIKEIFHLSKRFHEQRLAIEQKGDQNLHKEYLTELLNKAQKWLLYAESSCYYCKNPVWTKKIYDNIKPGMILLEEIEKKLS